MKKLTLLVIVILIISLMGCAAVNENENDEQKDKVDINLLRFEDSNGIDFSAVNYIASEGDRDKEIEDIFAEVYDLKKGEDKVRYYYNRIDLNEDDKNEVFVFLVGSLVCGSGGCSALLLEENEGKYSVISRFSLVNNPVIISKNKTNGWNDIIIPVSGGGIQSFFAKMEFDGKEYPVNPSVQPAVESNTKIEGTAIIADDISKNPGIEF